MQLKDIKDVKINTNVPCEERIRDYINQVGDPYRYLDGDIMVEVHYAETKVSLQDRLISAFR